MSLEQFDAERYPKAVRTGAIQLQYNYCKITKILLYCSSPHNRNTTAIQEKNSEKNSCIAVVL